MSGIDEILGMLPINDIARRVESDPATVQSASAAILPALLGGLQANAQGGGSASILEALTQHDNDLLQGGVDVGQIDTNDGQAIASHIFGSNEDQVVNQLGAMQLGGTGGIGSSLVKKLLPILAPIVMSYIANQVLGRMGGQPGSTSSGGGGLGDILGQVLGGGSASGSASGGGGLGDILGQVLGGGSASQAPQTSPSLPSGGGSGQAGPGSLDSMLQDVLGGALGQGSSQAAPQQSSGGVDVGGILGNVLGGLLGGGRR